MALFYCAPGIEALWQLYGSPIYKDFFVNPKIRCLRKEQKFYFWLSCATFHFHDEELWQEWKRNHEQMKQDTQTIDLTDFSFLSNYPLCRILGVVPVSIPIGIDLHWKIIYLTQYSWSLIKQNYTNFAQPLPVIETRYKK